MSASPQWKVYASGQYVAACKSFDAATILADWYGRGAEVRLTHSAKKVRYSYERDCLLSLDERAHLREEGDAS